MGLLWTAWLILQRVMESGEGPTAEFIEITPADPVLSCDLWEWDPTEEVKDGGDALGNLRGQAGWDSRHGGFPLVVDHARWYSDCVEHLECAMIPHPATLSRAL